jgi:hypothetical protein
MFFFFYFEGDVIDEETLKLKLISSLVILDNHFLKGNCGSHSCGG